MITVLVLATWVALVVALAWRLVGATWPTAAPRTAMFVWWAVLSTLSQSIALIALLASHGPFKALASRALGIPTSGVDALYGLIHGGAIWVVSGSMLMALGYLGLSAACEARSHTLARRWHWQQLRLVGTATSDGVTHIDSDVPAIYCLPGQGGHIVVTHGAAACLSTNELAAALTHERAHLRGRHHWSRIIARGIHRALPIPLTARIRDHLALLVEMSADDCAAHAQGARVTASALLAVAGAPLPREALGAGSLDAARRARRLMDPPRLSPVSALAWRAAGVGLALVPAAIVAAPVLLP